MKCFYHRSDLDGHCSGAIVKRKYPDCEMIGVDYNDHVCSIKNNEKVFVVDFSFSKDEMLYLHRAGQLTWIDHHKSAIEKMKDYDDELEGLREIGKAGCELTWQWLFPEREDMPLAVFLLGRYDVWDHKDEHTLPFQYGVRQFDNTLPDNKIWEDLLGYQPFIIDEIIRNGKLILAYEKSQNAKYAASMSYEAEFESYRAIIMNKAFANSQAFDSVYDPEKHDIMILYGVKPGEFKYSIYCTKPDIDVSEIAKKYGGGGHKGAAGFFSDKLVI